MNEWVENAVHGGKVHTTVGKTAAQLKLAAMFAPGYIRKRARGLMQARQRLARD